jgi:hypothetical protein
MSKIWNGHPVKIVLKAGVIYFRDARVGCVVLNISDGGAGLMLEQAVNIPVLFDLWIGGEQIRHRCSLTWREDRLIGAKFKLKEAS